MAGRRPLGGKFASGLKELVRLDDKSSMRWFRSPSRERGSALVEAAFVAPVFFLMLFAVFEFGFLFRNSLATTNASREGGRAASVHGAGPETDFLVLQTIKHGISAQGYENIDYVIVYNITNFDDPIPSACHNGPVQDVCNYYVSADFDKALLDTNGDPTPHFQCGPTSVDRFYCPTDREASLGAVGGPDLVGVYVKTNHTFMTGFIGDRTQLDSTTVIRIEPEATG